MVIIQNNPKYCDASQYEVGGKSDRLLATVVVNGRIYAMGGVSNAGWEPTLSTVEEYDPSPTVSVVRSGSTLKVYWNGILESSDTAASLTWQAFNPSAWPYSTNPAQASPMKFYRARQP